jgi:hypothetical protein
MCKNNNCYLLFSPCFFFFSISYFVVSSFFFLFFFEALSIRMWVAVVHSPYVNRKKTRLSRQVNNRCYCGGGAGRIKHSYIRKKKKREGKRHDGDDLFEKINTLFSCCHCRRLMVHTKMPSSIFFPFILFIAFFIRDKDNNTYIHRVTLTLVHLQEG